MIQQFELLRDYLDALGRFPWHALAVTATLCVAGWTAVLFIPNQYSATGQLFLQSESVMGPLLKGLAAESDLAGEMAALMRRTLTSRSNLERVINGTDLALRLDERNHLESLMRELGSKVHVEGDRNTRIYTISYADTNPRIARDVVQMLMDIFIESSMKATRTDSRSAQAFLNREIADYEAKLHEAEERLKEFKRRNAGLTPLEGQSFAAQLAQSQRELELANLQLQEATVKLDALRAKAASQSARIREAELRKLRDNLELLRATYTDSFPDVRALQQKISELERRAASTAGDLAVSGEAGGGTERSGTRDLDLELGKAEGDVSALKVKVAALRQQVASLRAQADVTPKVEAELAQLNRDYDILKKTYEGLVQRREAAMLSESAGESTDSLQLKVVEAPVTPVLPVRPDRRQWISLVLAGSLGLGLVTAYLLARASRVVMNVNALRQLAGSAVIGIVALNRGAREVRARRLRLMMILGGWGLLGLAYLGLFSSRLAQTGLAGVGG